MSATSHSSEPWIVAKSGVSVDAGNVRIRQEVGAPREELAANARRMAACVNACKGIQSEDLEKAVSFDSYRRLIKLAFLADRAAAPFEEGHHGSDYGSGSLLEAAPDLLSSLKGLLDHTCGTDSFCEWCEKHAPKDEAGLITGGIPHRGDCLRAVAEAAIAKAEGRS